MLLHGQSCPLIDVLCCNSELSFWGKRTRSSWRRIPLIRFDEMMSGVNVNKRTASEACIGYYVSCSSLALGRQSIPCRNDQIALVNDPLPSSQESCIRTVLRWEVVMFLSSQEQSMIVTSFCLCGEDGFVLGTWQHDFNRDA